MSRLVISPKSVLQDQRIRILAKGLKPCKPYTLTSHLEDIKSKIFYAYSHYITDSHGIIDVGRDESVGGHYTGVFQMGLIAALQPYPGQRRRLRKFKRDVEVPDKIEIKLYEGHKKHTEIIHPEQPFLNNDFHYRHFMGPGVKRVPIREGKIRGTLFIPPGDGPFPGVIDMFGSAGGLLEYRSAQLATRGIISLALAYFDYEDLPKDLKQLDLKYFEDAVHILLNQEKVLKPCVGAIGVSKGGELALTMATFIPQVSLAVCINGPCSVSGDAMKISDDYSIPPLGCDLSKIQILDEDMIVLKSMVKEPEDFPETIVPVQKSNAHFLYIVGEDDQNFDSKHHAQISVKCLDKVGKSNNYEIRTFKGAGHLIEPPYSPFCFASYHKIADTNFVWGGELKGHTEAQELAWDESLNFIRKHLQKIK